MLRTFSNAFTYEILQSYMIVSLLEKRGMQNGETRISVTLVCSDQNFGLRPRWQTCSKELDDSLSTDSNLQQNRAVSSNSIKATYNETHHLKADHKSIYTGNKVCIITLL